MKFREIFEFEMRYQLCRYITWIFFIVILAFAALASWSMVDNVEEGEYFLNSPVIISLIITVSSMFCLLLTAAVAGNAAVRDVQTGMEPLLYTTPLNKFTYLGGRFSAAFSIQLMVQLVILLLIFIAAVIPALDEYFTSFNPSSYLYAIIYFAIPNALIFTGILFALALMSRKAMVSFLGAGMLFFLAVFSMDILSEEIGMWELAKKIDPSGITWVRELRFLWTPLEIPSRVIQPDASLVFNRLLWIFIGFLFFGIAYFRFNFIHHTGSGRKQAPKQPEIRTGKESRIFKAPVSIPQTTRAFTQKTKVQQAGLLCFHTFREMIREKVWLLLVATLGIITLVAAEVLEGQLGVPTLPTTWRVLQLLQFIGAGLVIALLITYYTGELVWKERDLRIDEITDASPISTWHFFLAKIGGLFLMILAMLAVVMVAGILIQLNLGNNEIDFWLYLRVLFGFRLLDLLLFTVIALCIHVLINQKYLGYLVIFVAYFYMNYSDMFGLYHNLLIFGSSPSWSYSEISGFDPYLLPWAWFKLYWIAWALLLALVIHLFWNRGKESNISRRFLLAKRRFSQPTAKVGVPAAILILFAGGFIFYNTNIRNEYLTPEEITERRALYEKKYGQYRNIPQPLLTAVKLEAEIFPEKRAVEVLGNYILVNKSDIAIESIHISTSSVVEMGKMEFSRKASRVIKDDDLGHRIYKLELALQPGDSIRLSFQAKFQQRGFSNNGINRSVVANGTYLGFHNMPLIGYRVSKEITDKKTREEHQLPVKPKVPVLEDLEARMNPAGVEKVDFEAVLGTSVDQIAITAGTLLKTWSRNNRNYFHYKTDVPITHNYEILSAVYEVHISPWKDVEIQIYHHPGHSRNLEQMLNGIESSLAYMSENFSPYPHRQIRLVEYPGSAVGLNGNPVTMSYSEGFSFYTPEKDARDLDFPFAVVAHEVAHQWWGNELRPAYAEGAPLLTESLAWYSAMMIFEKTYGADKLDLLLTVMRREYLTPRTAADVPLLRTTDKFNAYRKGPFAMFALKEYIGEQQVNSALKNLLVKFGSGEPPLPVSLDLYKELQAVTPDSLQYLLKDLFERNTFWELKAEKAIAEKTEKGDWTVTFEILTKKLEIDKEGRETEWPMNDYIEIGIYANSPEGELGELLYLKNHQLRSGEQKILITVSKEPDVAGIDPNRLLIDREIYDNFVQVNL